jgi:hypothetical protein
MLCVGDATYYGLCAASASGDASANAAALMACLTTHGCTDPVENEAFTDCVVDNCESALETCFTGTGGCRDIWTCRKGCDPSDLACPIRCYGEAPKAQQDAWVAYETCVLGSGCATSPTNLMPNGWPLESCEDELATTQCAVVHNLCIPVG